MEIIYDKESDTYQIKQKIDNQTFVMGFECVDYTDDTAYFNVYMALYNKRKHMGINEETHRLTGKSPFKTAIAARNSFEKLEEYVVREELRRHNNVYIMAFGTDSKRKDLYYRYLSSKGYQYGMYDNHRVIFKIFKR